MVVIACFELSFRSCKVNKAIIRCCRYIYIYYNLSKTLALQLAVWF